MKKHLHSPFNKPYIDDEVDEKNHPPTASVEESLVALIFDHYAPVETMPESTDQKTTTDLIEEMEPISEVSKSLVKLAMEEFGFKLHYTGSEFVWLLKQRTGA